MRSVVLFALVPGLAFAEDGGKQETPRTEAQATPVIGGAAAPAGKWPDTAALLWSGYQECTGTLIAPTVVLTAGHCVNQGAPDSVLLGATRLSRPNNEGEEINVTAFYEYPDSWNTIDAGILVLERAATVPPRAVATGWAKFDIKNAASIQLVGFGTTDRNGTQSTDSLMEATSTITDYNCSRESGCNTAAMPDGELGAGGMGIDTCPGDSGGPLYLLTAYGSFVAGITSRGYDTAQYACSEGGIYGRPDKIVDWIEKSAGVKVTRGPMPTAEPLIIEAGEGEQTIIVHNDPHSMEHTYAITEQSMYATAAVREDGTVRVCAGTALGSTEIGVTVTDATNPTRQVTMRIPITIEEGDGSDCDPTDFDGGCCDTRRNAAGSLPLAMAVLLVLRRKRK